MGNFTLVQLAIAFLVCGFNELFMQENVENNATEHRYELVLPGGEVAHLDYRWHHGELALMHTFVPPAHEGRGYASTLAKAVFADALQRGVLILVYCPFVATYVKRHPELASQVSRQYQP